MQGLMVGDIAVGVPVVRGIAIAGLTVGGHELHGIMLSPITIKVSSGIDRYDGVMHGIAISAFNDARKGEQRGLMISVLNIADRLHGVQLGLLNIVRNNPAGRTVLPLVNWNFSGTQ